MLVEITMLSDHLCVQASACMWQWGWGVGLRTQFNWR